MKFSLTPKTKKIVIASTSSVLAVVLIVVVIIAVLKTRTANMTVDVEQVTNVSTYYWGDQSYTYGIAESDYVQELYPDREKAISEIFVKEGDSVKIGDTLLQYDTTKLELTVESSELDKQKKEYELEQAKKELTKLQNTRPYVEPAPVVTPSPTPIPASTAELYEELNMHSKPFKGTGTPEDPYVFLCTEDCVLTREFLLKLLGVSELRPTPTPIPTQEPTPMPSAEPTPGLEESSEPDASVMSLFTNMSLTSGVTVLTDDGKEYTLPNGPFAVRLEVHEENNENLPLIKGWQIDGDKLSAGFIAATINEPGDVDIPELDEDAGITYTGPMYTADELKTLIQEKKQQILDLELEVKQAAHEHEKAKLAFDNATVKASVDGTVKTLIDLETALETNSPFMVVSGGDGFYVTATLSESLLESIHVGDIVMANSWESGQMYMAEIVSISDFPNDRNDNYDGSTNPNSSSYSFTARIEQAGGLQNGMWLDITMEAGADGEAESGTFYLFKAYIRSDDGGKYVLKVGEDGRIHKTYIQTGKTIYSEYTEIKSNNLTEEDYIAFPYGKNAVDGAKANGIPEDNGGIEARGIA